MTKINFNGHQVDDVLEGVYAVINHYVNPVVGMIRLDDEDGRPYNKDRLRKAYMNAAVAILEELGKHVTERLAEDIEEVASSETPFIEDTFHNGLARAAQIVEESW